MIMIFYLLLSLCNIPSVSVSEPKNICLVVVELAYVGNDFFFFIYFYHYSASTECHCFCAKEYMFSRHGARLR